MLRTQRQGTGRECARMPQGDTREKFTMVQCYRGGGHLGWFFCGVCEPGRVRRRRGLRRRQQPQRRRRRLVLRLQRARQRPAQPLHPDGQHRQLPSGSTSGRRIPAATAGSPGSPTTPPTSTIQYFSVTVFPGSLVLHPGPQGEYAMVRFTVPASSRRRVRLQRRLHRP
jgi:hypothetical protein